MLIKNTNSKRENPFRDLYDNREFKSVLTNKDKLPDFPFLVDIELTNICNLKCIFCGQQTMTREKGFISESTIKKVADECAEHKTPIRLIRWGEPFMHPKIIDFCKYIKNKGILLHITNNGLAIKEWQMKSLVDIGVDSVIFSFQGATKEEYELMRDNKMYDKLRENILKLVRLRGDKEKPFIHISSTMTNDPKEYIDKFISYWGNIVDSVGIGKTNLSRLSDNQIDSFEKKGRLSLLKEKETIKKRYLPCTEVYQKLSVDWDGKVSCCCGDYDRFMIVGDINESSLKDIWNNSQKLKIFRQMLDFKSHKSMALCSTCYHAYEEF